MAGPSIGKYARLEVERRYLLRGVPPGAGGAPRSRITDHYLLPTRLRLRRVEADGGVTFKLGQKYRSAGQAAAEATITNVYQDEREYELLRRLGGVSS